MKPVLEKIIGIGMTAVGGLATAAGIATIAYDPHNFGGYLALGSGLATIAWGVEHLNPFYSEKPKDDKAKTIKYSYPCDECHKPITVKSGKILTGTRDGKRLFFHTHYPQTILKHTGMSESELIDKYIMGNCAFDNYCSLENPQTVDFGVLQRVSSNTLQVG